MRSASARSQTVTVVSSVPPVPGTPARLPMTDAHSSSRAERRGAGARQNGSADRDRPVAQAVRTGMRAGRRWVPVALACSALVLGGCTSTGRDDARPGPAVAEPWPDRPVVELRFEVAPDLATGAGRENAEFPPDLDTRGRKSVV